MDNERSSWSRLRRSSGGGTGAAVVHHSGTLSHLSTSGAYDDGEEADTTAAGLYSRTVRGQEDAAVRRHSSSSNRGSRVAATTAATSTGRSHSPAVWLFEGEGDEPPQHDSISLHASDTDEDYVVAQQTDEMQDGQLRFSSSRHRRPQHELLDPHAWVVDNIEVEEVASTAKAAAPSPRVLNNRIHFMMPHATTTTDVPPQPQRLRHPSSSSREMSSDEATAAAPLPRRGIAATAPPEEITDPRSLSEDMDILTTVTVSHAPSRHSSTRTKKKSQAVALESGGSRSSRLHHHRQHRHPHHTGSSPPSSLTKTAVGDTTHSRKSSHHRRARRDSAEVTQRRTRHGGTLSDVASSSSSSSSSITSSLSRASSSSKWSADSNTADVHAPPMPASHPTVEMISTTRSTRTASVTADASVSQRIVESAWDGLGPLMIVHLDVLPELRPQHSTAAAAAVPPEVSGSTDNNTGGETSASLSRSLVRLGSGSAQLQHLHQGGPHDLVTAAERRLLHVAGAEELEAYTREVAALHAQLEVAEQRVRVTEQQTLVTAEQRAAELVRDYKADERKRRAQFQATLDALREENRELTAKLEAAARAPAMGLRPSSSTTAAAAMLARGQPPSSISPAGAAEEGGGKASVSASQQSHALTLAPVREADVARQVQAVEAYWRDRLRTAERHWEDEMARQSRQRREALDQVEELVRTVEQSQEELRYTRRQAARLREENTRLSSATALAGGTATSLSHPGRLPTTSVSAEEVVRLRQTLKEHEHREAALLAQVESYGEEATQLRMRYEAALEKAQQDVAAERRRSTEMVKLYGSQLESLHHQLREAKMHRTSA